jgi:hypothetical protein
VEGLIQHKEWYMRTYDAILVIYNVIATAKHWNRMSKIDQNTCLETPDTTPNASVRYSSSSEDIPSSLALSVFKIRPRTSWQFRDAFLTMWGAEHLTFEGGGVWFTAGWEFFLGSLCAKLFFSYPITMYDLFLPLRLSQHFFSNSLHYLDTFITIVTLSFLASCIAFNNTYCYEV